jgi:hypothetical protein
MNKNATKPLASPTATKVVSSSKTTVKESPKPKTIAEKIEFVSFKLTTYFTSAEVIRALKGTYRTMEIHRGAINAAIATLAKNGKAAIVRHGSGRRDTIWTWDGHSPRARA